MEKDRIIPVELFGKDHWSMLAYIETVCERDGGIGEIDFERMRCNPGRHPIGHSRWKDEYSTILKGGTKESGHDDLDCIEDLETLELIEVISLVNGFIKLTDKGLGVAMKLRVHKIQGGQFATFEYQG